MLVQLSIESPIGVRLSQICYSESRPGQYYTLSNAKDMAAFNCNFAWMFRNQ